MRMTPEEANKLLTVQRVVKNAIAQLPRPLTEADVRRVCRDEYRRLRAQDGSQVSGSRTEVRTRTTPE